MKDRLFYCLGTTILDSLKLNIELKDYRRIFIYGAGMVGQYTVEYLSERALGPYFSGFIVSEKSTCANISSAKGFLVFSVDEVVVNQHDAVLVAVTQKYRNEIRTKCKEKHFKNVIEIDVFDDRNYEYYRRIPESLYKYEVGYLYEKELGRKLILNPPQTYNEYINWEKLYEKDPLRTQLADKYKVRAWIAENIGKQYLPKLYGCWENANDINFQIFPEKYVLKCNHGCGWNVIVKKKLKEVEKKGIINKLNSWLQVNYAFVGLEMQYKDIHPKIIAEEYLENKEGDIFDYKVFCFHGVPKYIMFLAERQSGDLKMAFYDVNWNKQDFVYTYRKYEKDVPRPEHLEEMLELSSKLSSKFKQVRVDWYDIPNVGLKFGEMTFSSCNGLAKWEPAEVDNILGQMIDG